MMKRRAVSSSSLSDDGIVVLRVLPEGAVTMAIRESAPAMSGPDSYPTLSALASRWALSSSERSFV
jgi:hypothetical protein